ncbi:MAG: hypothetical protein J5956_14450 [Ruminococcus sp.]|nr:hypothetical protein [Ruminococcus sp.]
MNNNQYNEKRFSRKIHRYRFILGLQQMRAHPLINLVWLFFLAGVILFIWGAKRLELLVEMPSFMTSIFHWCLTAILIFFPIICAIAICQLIGYLFARSIEADMSIVFGSRRNIKNQSPILIYKRTDRRSGVTKMVFYTSIPMERWKENKEAICDRLDIHIIKDFDYGGKRHNKGNFICFYSAKGRLPEDRGIMYDDEF